MSTSPPTTAPTTIVGSCTGSRLAISATIRWSAPVIFVFALLNVAALPVATIVNPVSYTHLTLPTILRV